MRYLVTFAVFAGAATMALPAFAATGLECIDEGYTPDQEQIFEEYYASFSMASLDKEEGGDTSPIADPVASRAAGCALEHGWSPDATYSAIVYRMAVLLSHGLEKGTPLTPEELDRLEQAFDKADQAKLRAILGPGIEASLKGEDGPEMSEEDKTYLGLMVIGAGLPMEQAYAEFAGALLGARMMAVMAEEKFAEE